MIRIAAAQMRIEVGKPEKNLERVIKTIRFAKENEVDLLVFPELALFGPDARDLYYDNGYLNKELLPEVASHATNIAVVLGFVDYDSFGHLYNAAAVIENREVIGVHHKVMLYNYGLFSEKRYFTRGRKIRPFQLLKCKIGVAIGDDLWFPEIVRTLTLKGADLIVSLAASPFNWGKIKSWENYLISRATGNLIPVLFCNSVGTFNGVCYWGGSRVLSEKGNTIIQGKLFEEDFIIANIDLKRARRIRLTDLRVKEIRREMLKELLSSIEEGGEKDD